MVGWFGVQNAVFGEGMAEIVPFTDFLGTEEILPGLMPGVTPEYILWAIITGLGITLLVVFGIKAIANFATVFVPLFVIVVIVAAAIVLQNHSTLDRVFHGASGAGPHAGCGHHPGGGRVHRRRHHHA